MAFGCRDTSCGRVRAVSRRCRLAGLVLWSLCGGVAVGEEVLLNDPHSRLNATWVAEVVYPGSTDDVIEIVRRAARDNQAISISGGRHSMGGQQFGTGTVHISTARMNDILAFDADRGIVTVEAGIRWPELIDFLVGQRSLPRWSIVQKQTGADGLSIGGSISTNIHGRGLTLRPLVQDIEAFRLVTADGKVRSVSRGENAELFRLVVGGYGLFGVITTVDLRLAPRQKLRRTVEVITLDQLPAKLQARIAAGHRYGDFQFKTDTPAPDFLTRGVFSTYQPIPDESPIPEGQRTLTRSDWRGLFALGHYDKARAFDAYVGFYLRTDGQVYWSDTHQLSYYDPDYESYLRSAVPDYRPGSLMISELYVPIERLEDFMLAVRADIREHGADLIYGTVRLIRADRESFLAWADKDYACVIFNLRVEHDAAGIAAAQGHFTRLIDRALERDGSYFPTYHRWARKDQVLAAYPQFPEFLRRKLTWDPNERFQSDWYRFYRRMFAVELVSPR